MSIKDLFNNKGVPKIQKTVSSDDLVATVESSEFVEAKRKQHEQFIPPIDFTTASNFAKFGSAELYYEKAFERIHQYYPYDGTLHEKIEFENSSSYLDKYVFDNLYPRTNGYMNFDSSAPQYISILGGPHTASSGMAGKTLDSTFDLSMKYDEEKKRTSAFEFRGSDGITTEFWYKAVNNSNIKTIFHISGTLSDGEIYVEQNNANMLFYMKSGSASAISENFAAVTDTNWNHYAVTVASSSSGIIVKGFKNGKISFQNNTPRNIPHILPKESGLNARIGRSFANNKELTGSLDEFRFWKTARTPEQIFNNWFIPIGGGTNKHDANVSLSCYFKFNEGITGNSSLDSTVLDYSGRLNNGTITNYASSMRNTGSAIREKLNEPEFLDPIIYSSHPDVVSKKAEYKTSGSLADYENTSMVYSYFPSWMQEEDEQYGKQLKYLSQVIGSYFDTLWHQISFVNKIHDDFYNQDDKKSLPFAKKLLYDKGFVMPDMFVDATLIENLRQKDDNEVYENEINEVRNTIYHNLYSNLNAIYKSKGTEKSFRNFFRSIGIGQDVVKLRMYADDSTFVLRNNYEDKSYERKFLNFNVDGHYDGTIYQTTSSNNTNIYIPKDNNYTGSFTAQTEVILPRKQRIDEPNYNPFPYLSASLFGYHTGQSYTTPSLPDGLQAFVVHSKLEKNLHPSDKQRVKFVLTGSNINLETQFFTQQYENNKWSIAVKLKHASYPRPNVTGSIKDNYLLEFYGVEADGNTERNSFSLVTSSVAHSFYSSDKIFYAGAHRENFTGSTTLHYTDVKLGYLRYWHSFLSNEAIKQHAFDSETFGANEPFEQDLVNVYPIEIPREKTLAFHWAFHDLTSSDASGRFTVSDLSSGSSDSHYGSLSDTIQRYVAAYGIGFNNSSNKIVDKNFLYSSRKRLPDDLMSSDLTTIKTDETEQFFVDEDVSDNFYSFEKSMWGTISDEMMNMFSTALDLNNLIGQPNQRYHHRYALSDFLRDRFFDDVENEPDIEKFTSFYKWIDDSISIALQQLVPASARFSEKINNIIESHVLERNKYVHQIPITTNFESTEGSIKGHGEMNYNWRFGHAPIIDNEANHTLWQRERKKKDGLRETLRNSRNNHSIQSSGLTRRDIGGSTRISDTYAIRRFAKTYDIGISSQDTIHGGTNFGRKKNLQLFHESIAPAGALGPVSSVPQNVITVGVGAGRGIVAKVANNDDIPRKQKLHVNALVGNKEGLEYGYNILGDFIIPMNVMSGSVKSGFNSEVDTLYRSGSYFTNLHHDIVGNYNETSIQGPFTEQHVGGLQYRHIDLNEGSDNGNSRPEGWGLVLRDHPVNGPDADGAFGFIGPDYKNPYPSSTAQKANRYRDEHAKRPVNLRNIKTILGSQKAGNYTNEIQLFSVSPTFQKTWAIEAYENPNIQILPTSISSALPQTTHYQSLMGIATFSNGNVFGTYSNNRQPDGALHTAAILGAKASGSFEVSGATVSGTTASGSFNVTGSPYAGAAASGSFQITSSMVQGTSANGSFTMSGAFAPAVSASYDFRVIGRTVLGSTASGSFNVSGAFVPLTAATASFDVSGLPVGGQRAYNIFDACYQVAADSATFKLGRNSNANAVEIDYNGEYPGSNTPVFPVTFQKAAEVSGSYEFFSGSAVFSNNQEFVLNFWISASANAINGNVEKYLYESREFAGGTSRKSVEVFLSASSGPRKLVIKRYVNSGADFWQYTTQDEICSDKGLPWTMVTIMAQGGSETKVYFNATASNFNPSENVSGPNQTFNSMTVNEHYVMSDSGTKSHYSGSAKISDFMMWNKNIPAGSPAIANAFVEDIYNDGRFEPSVPSGSLLGWRYRFGDEEEINTRHITASYGSGSALSGSYTENFVNSCFATTSSATTYFSNLKTAIESHNSDGTYFDVHYREYIVTASSGLTSYVSGASLGLNPELQQVAFMPGEGPGHTINVGDALNFARFYINSKQESDHSNYDITSSVTNAGKTGQNRSFIQVHTSSQSSAQQNALDSIHLGRVTIDGGVIRFDDHASLFPATSDVKTFSTTGSAIAGSSTTSDARFTGFIPPTNSPIYNTGDLSISYWHAADSAGPVETIVELKTPSHDDTVLVYAETRTMNLVIKDTTGADYRRWMFSFASPLDYRDFNHFLWSYSESTQQATLYVNGVSSSLTIGDVGGTFSGLEDSRFSEINIAGSSLSNDAELQGRLAEVALWSGSLGASVASEIYNDGRAKDLYQITNNSSQTLAHWYRFGSEASLPSHGNHLGGVATIPDQTYIMGLKSNAPSTADLIVITGSVFTVTGGIPSDTISNATFWNNLSSSIEANVPDYDVAFSAGANSAAFTVTNETAGAGGNGDDLIDNSTLISNLETTTGGGTDQSGVTDGAFITIDSVKFEIDDDNTSDGGGTFYIQNTGSNDEFWNALSQSIKNNTDFDIIGISGTGLTRTFSVTSSVRTAADNNVIGSINGEFSIVNNTAGGVDDTGANDGDSITLRPTSDAADARTFTVDRDNDGSNTSTQKFIHSVQSSNADWWNALSASIKAEGFGVSYVADSPSAGIASFTITSNVAAAAGNNEDSNSNTGATFTNTGGESFAGGLDASGSLAGHTLTVSGTVFTLIDTGSPSATQVLTTGSGVTSETMFEDLRAKIEAATIYTVTTASSGIPRLFEMTASVTGSGKSPNLAVSGDTFARINIGTDGVNEVGAEAGDSITIGGQTFTIVSGTPAGTQISFTGSSAAIRNALSQSIKDNTIFDNITVTDLGTGYHRFDLTASAVGTSHNGLFTTNSSGVRETFINLAGAAGGQNSAGIVDTDNLIIGSITFHLTASTSESDTGTNKFIQTTGSSTQIWTSLKDKIEASLPYTVATSSASGIATFSLTASTTGSAKNSSIFGIRPSFDNITNIAGGTDESGIKDGEFIAFAGKRYVLTASAESDSSTNKFVNTTGLTSTQIWSALKTKIETVTSDYTITTSSAGGTALFQITASATGSAFNTPIEATPSARSFFTLSGISGGVTFVPAVFGPDNVIQIPRTDLTGSERNIVTRFSAPGGVEIQTIGYLDAYTSTYSVHNALPFRNSSVLGSGSGEETTIRVEDHLGKRRGLRTLRALHMGRFGIDSQYGSVTAAEYPNNGSFNKQHRNTSKAYQYSSGELIITGSNHDNMHINTPIPRSEFQYSWINSAIPDPLDGTQHILGYAPRDGIVSSSIGYVEAIVFPSASSIIGS